MQAVCFHPPIQNSPFILPINSPGWTPWSMNSIRGKVFYYFPYLSFRALGLTQLPIQSTVVLFRENGKMHVAMTTQPHEPHVSQYFHYRSSPLSHIIALHLTSTMMMLFIIIIIINTL